MIKCDSRSCKNIPTKYFYFDNNFFKYKYRAKCDKCFKNYSYDKEPINLLTKEEFEIGKILDN
jgi:hypothetical protein